MGEKPIAVRTSKTTLRKSAWHGPSHGPVHILSYAFEKPIMRNCGRLSFPNKQNKIEHINSPATKMPMAISTPNSEKAMEPLRTRARKPTAVVSAPKKKRASKFCYRCCDCLRMPFSIGARLMITPNDKNREVDPKADENRAKTTLIMLSRPKRSCPELEQPGRRGEGRVPFPAAEATAKTNKENRAYQQHRAKQRRQDVVAHAQRNFRCKGERPVTRTCNGPPFHPSAAFARNLFTSRIKRWHSKALIDCWFVSARKTRIVRSGDVSGLLLFNDRAFRKRLQRRRNQTQGIERKLELGTRRSRFDLLAQASEADREFSLGLQHGHGLAEGVWLQIEK